MAKGAKSLKETEEKAAVQEEKAIVAVEATSENLTRVGVQVTPYNPNTVQTFGNDYLQSLIAASVAEEEAQKTLAAAGEARVFLAFNLAKAVVDLYNTYKDDPKKGIDIYAVFGEAKDVEKLNRNVLIAMGIMEKAFSEDGDSVVYNWTDTRNEKLYSYTKALKEEDAAEYEKRFNNRKRLNMRLSEAYKAAVAIADAGMSPDDMFFSEDETGRMVPTLRNAPKAIAGDSKDGIVQLNQRKAIKGATLSPTMTSLVKAAKEKHTEPKGDRTDKGENREGEAKLGMTDEAFGGIVNTLKRAINAQEGNFSEEMQKHITSLQEYLDEVASNF